MSDPEQVLCTFGPFGTAVCPGHYRAFTWQKSNSARVERTGTRVRGRRKRDFFIFGNSSPGGRVVLELTFVSGPVGQIPLGLFTRCA